MCHGPRLHRQYSSIVVLWSFLGFFQNAKKAKLQAKTEVSAGKKTSIVIKTVAHVILTTSELGAGKRRVAHLLGMYGTIIFWISSVIMIFCYSSTNIVTPTYWTILLHIVD